MITNKKIVLFRLSPETEEYESFATSDAWVFEKKAIAGSTKGDENTDVIHIRVRKDAVDGVKVGDYVHIGNLDIEPSNMSECRKVVRVTNNQYGTIPHWHLEV